MGQLAAESQDERDRRLTRSAWGLLMQMPDDESEFLALSERLWGIAVRDLKMPLPACPFGEHEGGPEGDGPLGSNVTPLRRGAATVALLGLAFALQFSNAPGHRPIQICCQADVEPIWANPVVGR